MYGIGEEILVIKGASNYKKFDLDFIEEITMKKSGTYYKLKSGRVREENEIAPKKFNLICVNFKKVHFAHYYDCKIIFKLFNSKSRVFKNMFNIKEGDLIEWFENDTLFKSCIW